MQRFFLLLVAVSSFCIRPAAFSAPPNILLILADDLKYHDLGFTGSKDIPTPHIDALAKSGVFCSQAYCTAPLCAPSRAGLLTGRNQARFGFDFNPEPYVAASEGNRLQHPDRFKNGLPQSEKTIASYLKAAGYKTAWIGKWHLGEAEWAHPKTHGFEHCYGFLPGVQSYRPMTALEAKRTGDTPPLNNCLMNNGVWVKNTGNLTDLLGAEAARYIAATRDAPWFMYCAFNAPHGPWQTDPVRDPKFAHITNDTQRKLTTTLVALDDAVGAIMKSLRESGQLERTLVIFASDNGVSSVGEWGGGKGTMLEGGLRVPLFLSWPGTLAPNSMRHDRVSFLDLAPTVLAAAGVNVTPAMKLDGINLLPALTQDQPVPVRALAWRMDASYAFLDEGDWKLVGNEARQFLYNLREDPRERNDLAGTHPDKLTELSARWKAWDAENARPMWRAVSAGATRPTGADNRKKREAPAQKNQPSPPPTKPEQPTPEAPAPSPISAPATGAFRGASVVWHLGDAAATGDATLNLTPNGSAALGIELAGDERAASVERGGDGRVAKLDGGHLVIGKAGVDPMGDAFDGGAYTLLARVKAAGDALDGTFFSRWAGRDHMPVDFSAWGMPWGHLGTRGLGFRTSFKRDYAAGQAAVLDFYCAIETPPAGWQDLVVRLTPHQGGGPGVLDLFVNGTLLFRNDERQPGGLPFEFFLNETPGAIVGAEPGGRWPFRGLVDHVALWTRPLSDAEITRLSTGASQPGLQLKPRRVHQRDALGQYLLPPETSAAERTRLTNDELAKAIQSQIANDPWYPQYHLALVGLPCNLQSLYHRGRHHYMLVHRGEALNHNEVFRHLVSDDLVSWEIRPAPLGWPHPIWPNGTFLHGPDGRPCIVGGYPITLATAEDADLNMWRVRNDEVRISKEHPRYTAEPRDAPGKFSWEEGVTWRQGDAYYMVGGGSHWDRVNEQGRLERHQHDAVGHDFPLYRSTDLCEWRHTASFFTNPDPKRLPLGVECAQMIPLDGERWLWSFTHTYLVGRIQQHRFDMEHSDSFGPRGRFVHWGGWERDDKGRLILQTTKLLNLPVKELARLGWGRTHRLPLTATLAPDSRLILQPVEELTKLRRAHAALPPGPLKPGAEMAFDLPAAAHQEIRLEFTPGAIGEAGVRLGDSKSAIEVYYDAAQRALCVDLRELPAEANHIPNDRRLFTRPLAWQPVDKVTLHVFQDGALIEVFANEVNDVQWAWFTAPDQIRASLFTRATSATLSAADAWHVATIWKGDAR